MSLGQILRNQVATWSNAGRTRRAAAAGCRASFFTRLQAVHPSWPVLLSQWDGRHACQFVIIGHECRVLYITHLMGELCSRIKMSLVAACTVPLGDARSGLVSLSCALHACGHFGNFDKRLVWLPCVCCTYNAQPRSCMTTLLDFFVSFVVYFDSILKRSFSPWLKQALAVYITSLSCSVCFSITAHWGNCTTWFFILELCGRRNGHLINQCVQCFLNSDIGAVWDPGCALGWQLKNIAQHLHFDSASHAFYVAAGCVHMGSPTISSFFTLHTLLMGPITVEPKAVLCSEVHWPCCIKRSVL